MFLIRFDMRAPSSSPATINELYETAIDMASWGEANGCFSVVISQHHGSPDGYLPSPMILASAMAARTKIIPISVAALLVNMYDPIKLAEDMNILDIISGGRVSYTIGLGYRPEEYNMFGVDIKRRGKIMDEKLDALTRALRGEVFDYQGRKVNVTPIATSPNGVAMSYGGHTPAAARRAGRFGLGFMADGGEPELENIYKEAAKAAGHKPGISYIPPEGSVTSLHVAKNVDEAWDRVGAFLLHDARMYGQWMENNKTAVRTVASSVEELRAEGAPYRIVTPEEALEMVRSGNILALQPLCGGLPPEFAWESLKLVAEEVMPAL